MDYAEKKEASIAAKSPFALAAGFTFTSPDQKKTLYATIEYFDGFDAYRMIEADEESNL